MKKWLKSILTSALALVMFSGCSILPFGSSEQSSSSVEQEDDMCTVSFELCTDLKTNYIEAQEVEKGDIVTKPSVSIVGENTDRMEVEAWYTDAEYTTKWNFLIDTVEEDMTLYAKWIKKFAVNYYLGDAVDKPMYTQYLKEGEIIEPREDLADGYESKGFFANAAQTKEFEFGNPITQDVNV